MSIYSNVTEQDLDNLRKLADQQKEQRALKIKNRILKQTHDLKLAESLSPITERLDKVKESTEKLGDVIKESQPKTPQLAIENNPINQSIEDNEGRIYDVQLEDTLNKMADNTGFLKTYYDQQRGWILNNIPFKSPGGSKILVDENEYDLSKGIRNVLTKKTNKSIKSLNDNEKVVLRDFLSKIG